MLVLVLLPCAAVTHSDDTSVVHALHLPSYFLILKLTNLYSALTVTSELTSDYLASTLHKHCDPVQIWENSTSITAMAVSALLCQ